MPISYAPALTGVNRGVELIKDAANLDAMEADGAEKQMARSFRAIACASACVCEFFLFFRLDQLRSPDPCLLFYQFVVGDFVG